MMRAEIGQKAGEIFDFLKQNGELPLSTFERRLVGSRAVIQAAVGWLAREGKISFRRQGRSTLVKLLPEE